MAPVILTGWKEIAKHLRYGVRTAQRWERNGLPVKRISNSPRSPVVGDCDELDAWILHRIQLPPGAPRKLAENRQRARELCREAKEIKKELQARMDVLKKTLTESRAKVAEMIPENVKVRHAAGTRHFRHFACYPRLTTLFETIDRPQDAVRSFNPGAGEA